MAHISIDTKWIKKRVEEEYNKIADKKTTMNDNWKSMGKIELLHELINIGLQTKNN